MTLGVSSNILADTILAVDIHYSNCYNEIAYLG